MKTLSRQIAAVSLLALSATACSINNLPIMADETASRLASAAWMVKRDVPAGSTVLRAFERMHERHQPANIYIEGEGHLSFIDNFPTPDNPVALHLATKDSADNLAYLGRPCQYVDVENCTSKYWNGQEYSDIVLEAYDAALNDIVARYDIKGIHLIGHSGGGTIAALLAERRSDILSVRSVAGIMDPEAHATIHGKTYSDDAISMPMSLGPDIKDVPQFHFIGGKDEYVPPAVLHSYLQDLPPTNCVHSLMVQEATHDKGWVDKWPELLKLPVSCYTPPEDIIKPEGTTDLQSFVPDFNKALKKKAKRKTSTEKPAKP